MVIRTLQKHSEKFDAFAKKLGRIGFSARSFVWSCIGGVAISAAFTGEETEGSQGALEFVSSKAGGAVVLIIATLGLLCYSMWRFFEGIYGLKVKPDEKKFGQVVNGYVTPLCSGVAYLIFAISNIVIIRDGIGNITNKSTVTETLSKYVMGKILLTLGGIVLFGVAIGWLVDLYKGRFKGELEEEEVARYDIVQIIVFSAAYLGTFGRAILFSILSVELLRVAFDDDIGSGGFGAALQQLQINTPGRILLVFVGVLLIVFGLFSLCQARYKKFLPYKPHLLNSDTLENVKDNIKKGLVETFREEAHDNEIEVSSKEFNDENTVHRDLSNMIPPV